MPAQVHLFVGPANSGKTTRLIERGRSASTLWLSPTPRAAEALRRRLQAATDTPLDPAFVTTFDQFQNEIVRRDAPTARLLSQAQRRLLVDEIIDGMAENRELRFFSTMADTRGFSDSLLGLMSELQANGVSHQSFAKAIAKQGADRIGRKLRDVVRFQEQYERALRSQEFNDLESRSRVVLSLLQKGDWQPYHDVKFLIVDGFADFTVTEQALLRALIERLEQVWISLPGEMNTYRPELFSTTKRTLQQLGVFEPKIHELQSDSSTAPAGIAHLERQLFRPLRQIEPGANFAGLSLIEAPGTLGEARMVARAVRKLLDDGVSSAEIIITTRDLSTYDDLLGEVFEEYGIPVEIEGLRPLARNPAIALLLKSMRLPDDDWPFAAVTALLRNTYFAPTWTECAERAEMPLRAETLLRLLGEPRGRAAYLAALGRWAATQQPGFEDEQAEEKRRRRTHELAQTCRAFLTRFFHAWDDAPTKANLMDHRDWLRRWADDLGIVRVASENPGDSGAFRRLWSELDAWVERDAASARRVIDRKTFLRRMVALASDTGLPLTEENTDRVRILSAESARHLAVDYLFLIGLGERSFPSLIQPPGLLDDADRQALHSAGIEWPGPSDLLPQEMLMFYQLVTRPRRQLTLSYPAVNERGQELLPSSFLFAVLDCFQPSCVERTSKKMLLEGIDTDEPLSMAERRVRSAVDGTKAFRLPAGVAANLTDAAAMAKARFKDRTHNPFDGLFHEPALIAEVSQRFGPSRILSPTALEDYVACPYKFYLSHVLGLEPLEEPREEIEVTRRGQALHRALARFHGDLQKSGIEAPTPESEERFRNELTVAIEQERERAPSLAAKALWQIEGERLQKSAERYGEQWSKFLEPWRKLGTRPRPHFFEIDFGLPSDGGAEPNPPLMLRIDENEVRISGRIDRVDVVELADGSKGFWIIDYKSGKGVNYTAAALSRFEKLQLTLYAYAVEDVLLAGQNARPLGLAYWLVTDVGPKVVLPGRRATLWLEDANKWAEVRKTLLAWITTLLLQIRRGAFPLEPRSETCTQTCAFGQICRITQARSHKKEWSLPLPGADEREEEAAGE